MGTWGTSAFEDDTALGFYDEFCSGEQSVADLEFYFDQVLAKQYNLKDDDLLMSGFTEPTMALMSAEIIAAALGNFAETYPDDTYHNDMEIPRLNAEKIKQQLNEAVLQKAKTALLKIKTTKGIHLTELWMESAAYEEWQKAIDNLVARLSN